ncbi:MAG: DUF1513 domain-containing protein [Betaproteobacteria bacterium]
MKSTHRKSRAHTVNASQDFRSAPKVIDPKRSGELIVGGGSFIDPNDRRTQRFVFSRVDLGNGEIELTDTRFLPHGVAIDPLNRQRIVAFQKIGAGCCELDLSSHRVTRTIEPTHGRWFYGHGAFSADGSLLYSTETINAAQRGVIGVRDGSTLQYLGEFPTFGENPHDCHLIDAGKVLVISNGGGALDTALKPCVTWVDTQTRTLLDRQELPSERFNTGHLGLSETEGLVVVSAPRKGLTERDLGAVSLRRNDSRLEIMAEPDTVTSRMFGEALSVAIHEPSGTAAVTHPGGNMVTFWSTRSATLLKVLDLPFARGVALTQDGENFIVSYGATADIVQVAPDTLEPVRSSNISQSYLSGSHVFNWTRMTGQ